MAITFDVANKIIQLDSVSVSSSFLWSRWIDWAVLSDNAKYGEVFSQVGGVAPVDLYIFLENGWRVRPVESDGITTITGNLLVQGGGSPIAPTLGNFNVLVNMETPVKASAINVESTVDLTEVLSQISLVKSDTEETRKVVEADEIHTGTTVQKRLRGTETVLITKNHTGTPLVDLQVTE